MKKSEYLEPVVICSDLGEVIEHLSQNFAEHACYDFIKSFWGQREHFTSESVSQSYTVASSIYGIVEKLRIAWDQSGW